MRFCFLKSKFALVSYVPKKEKQLLLFTVTLTNVIVPEKKNLPKYILDYNATERGVDSMNKMLSAKVLNKTRNFTIALGNVYLKTKSSYKTLQNSLIFDY